MTGGEFGECVASNFSATESSLLVLKLTEPVLVGLGQRTRVFVSQQLLLNVDSLDSNTFHLKS